MDATTALDRTDRLMAGLIDQLTADDRTAQTPCTEWTVDDLLEHVCQGGQMVAGGLRGQAPPDDAPDVLADGPAAGWKQTVAALRDAATPDVLTATHQMPFGEVSGEKALAVIIADHATHAWDLAQATGLAFSIDDDLAEYVFDTFKAVVPAEDRQWGFDPVVPVPGDAALLDRLIGYTGRCP